MLENAVDFARERVAVGAQWNEDVVEVTISDDGPGFAPEIMDRIGEPYVTSRRRKPDDADEDAGRTGLGLFHRQDLARTLRRDADASRTAPCRERGAIVTVRWSRHDFERPMAFAAS